MAKKICPNCNSEIRMNAVYCTECGQKYEGYVALETKQDEKKIAIQHVIIKNVQMEFGSMVKFMIKWVFASIPAMIIIWLIILLIALLFGALGIIAGI